MKAGTDINPENSQHKELHPFRDKITPLSFFFLHQAQWWTFWFRWLSFIPIHPHFHHTSFHCLGQLPKKAGKGVDYYPEIIMNILHRILVEVCEVYVILWQWLYNCLFKNMITNNDIIIKLSICWTPHSNHTVSTHELTGLIGCKALGEYQRAKINYCNSF
jgi:hypothetical protein